MQERKCNCINAKAYCKTHSKIKMVVMPNKLGKHSLNNKVFYNFLKENKKKDEHIIANMLKRLEKNFRNCYNAIVFYNNSTNLEIFKHKP